MKSSLLRFFLGSSILMQLLGLPQTAFAQNTYYVDINHSNASDVNVGSESFPWASINHAAQIAEAGDTVYVKAGVYRESVEFTHSGEEGNPIHFLAYDENDRPVLDGSDRMEGWSLLGDGVYELVLDEMPSSFYQDQKKVALSMQPNPIDNEDPYNNELWYLVEEDSVVESGSQAETDMINAGVEYLYLSDDFTKVNGEAVPDDFWVGAYLYHYNHYQGRTQVREVIAYDSSLNRIMVPLISEEVYNRILAPTGNYDKYALANHVALIDSPGEYAISGNTVYLRPYDDLLTDIEGVMRTRGIHLTQKNITIDGFEIRKFSEYGIQDTYRYEADNFRLLNSFIHHNGESGFACRKSLGTYIDGCEFSYNNANGISFEPDTGHIEIINSHVHHNNDNGIWFGSGGPELYYCQDILIKDCRVEFQGSSQSHPDNIQFQQISDLIVEDTVIQQAEVSGIQNMWCQLNGRITFRNCTFINGTCGFNDMSQVYLYNNTFYESGLRFDSRYGTLGEWKVEFSEIDRVYRGWDLLADDICGDIDSFPVNILWDTRVSIIQDIRDLPEGESLSDQSDDFKQRLVDYINSVIGDTGFYKAHPGLYDELDPSKAAIVLIDAIIDRGIMDAEGTVKPDLTDAEEDEILGLNRCLVEELVLNEHIMPSDFNYSTHEAEIKNNVFIASGITRPPDELDLMGYFEADYNYLNVETDYIYQGWMELFGDSEHNLIHRNPDFIYDEFADVDAFDFTPLSSGHLIDAGVDVGLSYRGIAPDLGATEVDAIAAPELIRIHGEPNAIDFSWIHRHSELIDSYSVWRSRTENGPWHQLGMTSELEWNDALVINDIDYYYAIRAHLGDSVSEYSNILWAQGTEVWGQEDFEDDIGTVEENLAKADATLINGISWTLLSGGASTTFCSDCTEELQSISLNLGVYEEEESVLISDQETSQSFDLEFDLIHEYVGEGQGVLLLYVDEDNHYKLDISRYEFRLLRVRNGIETEIGSEPLLSTQHQLSTAHYKISIRPLEEGLQFHCSKSNWILLNDPDAPIYDPDSYEVTFLDSSMDALSYFSSGALGFYQSTLSNFNVAGYDNIELREVYQARLNFADWQSETLAAVSVDEQGLGADPDADGLANLLEYAFNLNPLVYDSNPVDSLYPSWGGVPHFGVSQDGADLVDQITYAHRVDPSLSYIFETFDFTSNRWVTVDVQMTDRIINGDDTELRELQLSSDLDTDEARLYRIRTEYNLE